MATVHIDGKSYEVNGADNLLSACLSLGLDVPYFCWHPALGSVGSCRLCAVKQYTDENDKRGRLVMSCMTPSSDKTYISVDDAEAVAFRKSVIEWLMTNHPHDCPVCAEGGHCHLQDMTVMAGHSFRRYRFNKRTHANQNLGPFVRHEMNRCIACYRCVRYYKDYAGGTDLGVFGAHDNVYFGRREDGILESEFSGNLTEVCPTGVFTDKSQGEHYARKWDMQYAPSICQGCAVGCNISPGERYGAIRRVENRYHGEINHYFLCDRGRFGYGYVNREDRPYRSLVQDEAGQEQVLGIDAALEAVSTRLRSAKGVAGLGSARASLEGNHALRQLVGEDRFSLGWTRLQSELMQRVLNLQQLKGVEVATLRQMESADSVLIVGEDVTQTAPRVALALRQAAKTRAVKLAAERKVPDWNAEPVKNIAQHELSPVHILDVINTRLSDIALQNVIADPQEQARLVFAAAHIVDPGAPAVPGLSAQQQACAARIAADLLAAERPLLVAGVSAGRMELLDATQQLLLALLARNKTPQLALVVPEVNSMGLAMMGGHDGSELMQWVQDGLVDTLVVLEQDLFTLFGSQRAEQLLQGLKNLIVLDHQRTQTVQGANVVLATASFVETDGTVVNMEGRAQRFYKVFEPSYHHPERQIREGWRWLHALKQVRDQQAVDWMSIDAAVESVSASYPALAGIVHAAPNAAFRVNGLMKIAREPRRYSGRTAMRAHISVHEPRQPQDQETALAFSMEGYVGPDEPGALIPFAWAPGWNSPSAWNKFQDEVGGHLRAGDPGVRLLENQVSMNYLNPSSSLEEKSGCKPECKEVVYIHHIFGSEAMSARSDVLSQRIPEAYVLLHSSAVQQGSETEVVIEVDGQLIRLATRYSDAFPVNCVGWPRGIAPEIQERWVEIKGV